MDLVTLREVLQEEGYSEPEIDDCLKALSKVYLGQHVKERGPRGVLRYDLREVAEAISKLVENSLIEEEKWYSHHILKTTDEGAEAGEELIQERIEGSIDTISRSFDLDGEIIAFLTFDYIDEDNSFPKTKVSVRDWRKPLLEETQIKHARNRLFNEMVDLGLAVEVHSFVSTRGGERRELRYVISDEVRKAVQNRIWPEETSGINQDLRWKCEAYQFLRNSPNYFDENEIEESRETFWEDLEEKPFEEEYVENIINGLQEKDVTSSYRGLMDQSLPFEVLNDTKYQIALKRELVEPVVAELIESQSPDAKIIEEINQGEIPSDELNFLRKFSKLGNSPFDNQEESIHNQLTYAIDLYEDEYWSEFLLRINNVCEDLVLELYLQKGEEYEGTIEKLLKDNYRSRIEAIGNFEFLSEDDALKHRLLSIHLDRINSDAPHGGESEIVTKRDAVRILHDFVEIYTEIWDILE
ncbi:MAG: hypothetical protein ABEI86_00795 [Halobacteriaceae archaeon]